MSLRLAVKRSINDDDDGKVDEVATKKAKVVTAKKKRKTVTDDSASDNDEPAQKDVFGSSEEDDDDDDDSGDDSDSDEESEGEDLGYGSDLYMDEDDKAKLDGLPEIEREKILMERFEKRKDWKEMQALKKTTRADKANKRKARKSKVKKKTTKTKKKKTEKPAAKAPDSPPAASSRPTRSSSRKSDLEAKKRQVFADSDSSSDEDGDDDAEKSSRDSSPSEDDYSPVKSSTRKKSSATRGRRGSASSDEEDGNNDGVPTLESQYLSYTNLRNLQVRRVDLMKWYDKPYFDKIEGLYVRLFIGVPEHNRNLKTYRVCEIMEVQECKPYRVEKRTVNHALLLRFGKSEKLWKMEKVSNQRFEEVEYEFWKNHLKENALKVPSKSVAQDRFTKRQREIENYVFTEREIAEIVDKKKSRRKKAHNIAIARTETERSLKAAQENGDIEGEKRFRKRLEEIDEQLEEIRANMHDAAANVNERNMRSNIVAMNKIVMMEQQRKKGSAGEAPSFNPCVHRPTRPTTLWATRTAAAQEEKERAAEEAKAKAAEETKVVVPVERQDSYDSLGTVEEAEKSNVVNSVHASIKVDLDIDPTPQIPAKNTATVGIGGKASGIGAANSGGRKKKGMSLGEYWRRQTT